jgi:hypothetical protein
MMRAGALLLSMVPVLAGCHHGSAVTVTRPQPPQPVSIIETRPYNPVFSRIAYVINDEPPVFRETGVPGQDQPILYRGKPISPDQIKSIRALNAVEARKLFGDQLLSGAFLIELK